MSVKMNQMEVYKMTYVSDEDYCSYNNFVMHVPFIPIYHYC